MSVVLTTSPPLLQTLRRHNSAQNVIECLYLRGHEVRMQSNHEYDHQDHRCETSPSSEANGRAGMIYDLPQSVVDQLDTDQLSSGISWLRIEGASVHRVEEDHSDPDIIVAEEDVTVSVITDERERRLMIRTKGTSVVLVVRVESLDSSVSLPQEEIADRLFGLDRVSFASQYEACSNGVLVFEPANGGGVVNGVGTMQLDRNLLGQFMTNQVENELFEQFPFGSPDDYDHVLFCMPQGMAGDWIGYTYGRTFRSYFNNDWCGYYSLPFHEVRFMIGLVPTSGGTVVLFSL